MPSPYETQRVELDDCPPNTPQRCIVHIRRIDSLEHRMTVQETRMAEVEKLHHVLQTLAGDVRILNERVKLLLWVGGITATAIILALLTALGTAIKATI
jgi:hypothetical protein